MTARKQWLIVAGAIAFMAAGLWTAAAKLEHELFPIKIGGEAPNRDTGRLGSPPLAGR